MRNKAFYTFILILSAALGYSQISPGDLTKSHANLEGMSNCTLCHDIGKKVSNSKCLDCHKEIQSLLSQNKGYHASSNVKNKDCFACHSEHHGRNFDMVRFDMNNFNHNLTGYELEGKHEVVDCKKCHMPDNIANSELRKRKNTFLGLDTSCLSCHDDFHQKTLSNDCMACHTMNTFRPAENFDHNESNYPLKGAHAQVDCKACHKETTRNGKRFQEFSGISFNDCKACHADPHNNQLSGKCTQCHTESSFSTFIGRGNFNHSTTDFDLKGAHRKTDCFACHQKSSNPLALFQDNRSFEENDCVACHTDPHENKYGQDCAKCHNEESFLALNNMDFFDHSITDYPLEGNHLGVDCRKCHIERFSTPIDFSACSSCHSDYHNGEFTENGFTPDCATCHSLEKGFNYTLFTLSDHQNTSFPLEGAHVATPCFACHVSEADERWTFDNLGSSCVDCHLNIHDTFISASYYPQNDCTACHSSDAWDMVDFDHSKTEWPLTGEHLSVNCDQCHFNYSEDNLTFTQNFINLDTQCASCHDNIHDDAFAINGVTDCNRCHVTDSWFPEKFDHNRTAFKLQGKHAEIDCKACHEVENKAGETVVLYKLNKFECIDCHQ